MLEEMIVQRADSEVHDTEICDPTFEQLHLALWIWSWFIYATSTYLSMHANC